MKRILITGTGSYLGNSLKDYLAQWPERYQVDCISLRGDDWKGISFSRYDVIYHVAGIAHRKETAENAPLYDAVNHVLTAAVAEKARKDGVRQFIYLSSVSVYGMNCGVITKETQPAPKNNYGRSKLAAERALQGLEDETFRIAVIRPPMIYGKACKGNFQIVLKLVQKLPIFPAVNNRRSMIYVDNLSSFMKLIIDRELTGLYLPQDRVYMQTTHMAQVMAQTLEKPLFASKLCGALMVLLRPCSKTLQKAFGSLIYQETDDFSFNYILTDQDEAIKKSI